MTKPIGLRMRPHTNWKKATHAFTLFMSSGCDGWVMTHSLRHPPAAIGAVEQKNKKHHRGEEEEDDVACSGWYEIGEKICLRVLQLSEKFVSLKSFFLGKQNKP